MNRDRAPSVMSRGIFDEVESVKEFAAFMEELGVLSWWRKAMGYDSSSNQV